MNLTVEHSRRADVQRLDRLARLFDSAFVLPGTNIRFGVEAVMRLVLYYNLRSAVLERRGDAIRFNPTLLDFAGQYRYEPRRRSAITSGVNRGWDTEFSHSMSNQ